MYWIDEVELYLRLKVESNPSRYSFGVAFLTEHPESLVRLKVFAQVSQQMIINQAQTVNGVTSCKLTNVSINIGKRIISMLTNPRFYTWKDEVRLGDLFIETFYQLGYIDVVKPKFKSIKPIEIIIKPNFPADVPEELAKMTLHGTWSRMPKDIHKAEQTIRFTKDTPKYVKPIIKRWDEKLDGLFKTISKCKAIQALNKLQQVGWTIDTTVLSAITSNPYTFYSDSDKTEENISKKIDYLYTTTKAKALAEHDEFFYALDMDYRGRVYYIESYMNFQGSDLARGVLRFSNYKVVDESGLKWLKIHCASSYNQTYSINDIPDWCTSDYKTYLDSQGLDNISVDKMTLKDRVLWCDNNVSLISQTAKSLTLHNCDKCVSFLSACIEVDNYNNTDGPYLSNLPIPIDGSNNGWQHLGAISKDTQTGKLVGLVPVEIQNDFYVKTAHRLIELTKSQERLDILSSMPMNKIRKGISKRGSMTRAYSAGAQKIAENMYTDCKTAGYTEEYGITEEHCKGFARDLVKAIQSVCPGPLKTMKFLQQLANKKLDDGWNFITWTTPSGFPVVYTCNHKLSQKQRGSIKGLGQVNHVAKIESDKPDRRGFMCGISPNFIHSQDASHMSLVICEFNGDFGAVHDSFSTHASDVDDLLKITKEVFIDMYKDNNYYNTIESKIGCSAEQPELGNLNINDINNSDYFFA